MSTRLTRRLTSHAEGMFGSGGLFGGSKEPESPGSKALSLATPPPPGKDKGDDKDRSGGKGGSSIHGFDPTALERAAKAAKELDGSRNARDALRVINTQEATKQKEAEAERAKFQAIQQELAIRRIQEEEQAAERTLDKQTQHEKARAEYSDQLERKRISEQMQFQRKMQEEERKKAEESLMRQEAIRKKTLEYEAELRQQTEMARVKAETDGRILQERKNFDLTLEKSRADAKEYRETVMEGLKLALQSVGTGFTELISDRQKLANFAGTGAALAVGIYTAKTGAGVAGRFIEARLGKPSLVRETTRRSVLQMARNPLSTIATAIRGRSSGDDGAAALKDVVFTPTLEARLRRVAVSTANTKLNKAPFRHLLLHGPPGTGKTMFAKGLARESGLDYAIMTGGDVAPLGKDAVTEIHKMFEWANTTKKGVLLFIDEADAFLRKRSTEKMSEEMRTALNAFLYRTGEASSKIMIVFASNQPEQLDWAINDRIDDMIEFDLPEMDERLRMITQYMDKYLIKPTGGSRPITVAGVDEALLRSLATATEGFSGREISKLAIAWQAAAYGTANAALDGELLLKVLQEQLSTKAQKKHWLSKEEIVNLTRDYEGGAAPAELK